MELIQECEESLKIIKAKCYAQLWIQSNAEYRCTRIYNWLIYSIIALSSISSASLFSKGNDLIDDRIIQYTSASISLIAALLTGLIRHLQLAEMANNYSKTYKAYDHLIRQIDEALSITHHIDNDFIKNVNMQLNTIMSNQTAAPKSIVHAFEKEHGQLEKIMYGEDVVELMRMVRKTNKLEKQLHDSSSSEGGATQV